MNEKPVTLFKGKFLALVKEGHWEYAERVGATGAAIILAITPQKKIILVEQYRIPVHARTIELPAGIEGDTSENESEIEAARRELLEETGYEAAKMEEIITGPSSCGLTSEMVTIFLATDLRRIHAGGGIENENITVHEVAFADLDDWLKKKQAGMHDRTETLCGVISLARERFLTVLTSAPQ